VVLDFEKEELTKDRMRELMIQEMGHYGGTTSNGHFSQKQSLPPIVNSHQ